MKRWFPPSQVCVVTECVFARALTSVCADVCESERGEKQSWDSCSISTVLIILIFFVVNILFKIRQYYKIFAADKVAHNKS